MLRSKITSANKCHAISPAPLTPRRASPARGEAVDRPLTPNPSPSRDTSHPTGHGRVVRLGQGLGRVHSYATALVDRN